MNEEASIGRPQSVVVIWKKIPVSISLEEVNDVPIQSCLKNGILLRKRVLEEGSCRSICIVCELISRLNFSICAI